MCNKKSTSVALMCTSYTITMNPLDDHLVDMATGTPSDPLCMFNSRCIITAPPGGSPTVINSLMPQYGFQIPLSLCMDDTAVGHAARLDRVHHP